MSGRITGLSSMATRHILADLAKAYELLNGIRVDIRSMGGVEAAKLVRTGEPTDVVVLASKVMEGLEAEGHIVKGSIMDFARSEIAHCGPRRRAATSSRERASRQAGHARGAKNLLLDGAERRSLEGAVPRNGAWPNPC